MWEKNEVSSYVRKEMQGLDEGKSEDPYWKQSIA